MASLDPTLSCHSSSSVCILPSFKTFKSRANAHTASVHAHLLIHLWHWSLPHKHTHSDFVVLHPGHRKPPFLLSMESRRNRCSYIPIYIDLQDVYLLECAHASTVHDGVALFFIGTRGDISHQACTSIEVPAWSSAYIHGSKSSLGLFSDSRRNWRAYIHTPAHTSCVYLLGDAHISTGVAFLAFSAHLTWTFLPSLCVHGTATHLLCMDYADWLPTVPHKLAPCPMHLWPFRCDIVLPQLHNFYPVILIFFNPYPQIYL
ncbi:hypothetical protein DFH08DRAFT_235227 [Mycena albidolilacea]|uniref:Uncharacterized protein n=1 Tax=Mycena albidolilacea TaxID=1033008 RepID=A0AAD6ZW82_9AGAR|nr:hypothetical protein DFH08DRAFT_235227 [Mycena albidolilacea]